ncbi:MAG: RNA polymerase sigma factor [Clostridia bacterium]|nr:RNA polymerase sigma factor [Clostridia bacterium]
MVLDKFIKKFINGDASAFDEIYNRTRKSVYYVALSILRDKVLAEDVMQTTYMRVLKNIQGYTLGTNASAWIIKIAKNEAINVRKVRMREQYVDEYENHTVFGISEPDTYGELIDLAKRLLADDEFSILMLVTACGYKRKEIGKMLDMPISTVTWKYKNALLKMRNALEKEGC